MQKDHLECKGVNRNAKGSFGVRRGKSEWKGGKSERNTSNFTGTMKYCQL